MIGGLGMAIAVAILIAVVATRKTRPEDVWDDYENQQEEK